MNIDYVKMPIITKNFSNHLLFKEKTLNLIDDLRCDGIKTPEDSIYSTDWNIDKHPKKSYIDFIFPHLKNEIDIMLEQFNKAFPNLCYKNIWFQKYKKGDTHSYHRHPDSVFSIIYYLDLPKDSPVTSFIDPYNNKKNKIRAREGDIVIFPSNLLHCSVKNKSNKIKTIIGINLM